MTSENWRPVAGYEGLYQVSDLGRIQSLPRLTHRKTGATERTPGRELTQFKSSRKGYLYVKLSRSGRGSMVAVHRLVAMAFLPFDPARTHVNHISHNHLDNRAANLEWVTPKENTAAAVAAGKFAIAHAGGRTLAINNPNRRTKLTPEDVAAIRAACACGEKQADVGLRFGVTQAVVSKIKRGVIWSTTPNIRTVQHQQQAA